MKAKKKSYKGGGIFPPAIKKLRDKAAAKKAEESKPTYGGMTDEVTVTAKAPKKWEKRAAKAFVNSDSSYRTSDYYTTALQGAGGASGKEVYEKGQKIKTDTAKRLKLKDPLKQTSPWAANEDWIKALKKAGYRK